MLKRRVENPGYLLLASNVFDIEILVYKAQPGRAADIRSIVIRA